ncbi:unnamed protein product [Closterium sp. NIES-53]
MEKGVSIDSTDNSSRDNSSSINIGSSRDNSSSSNTDKSRSNNNSTSTNRQLFISTNSHHRHHTDFHSTTNSRPTQSSQKHQHHRNTDPSLHELGDSHNAHSGHLGIEKHYNAWKILYVHSKETVATRDVIFYERIALQTYLDNLAA